ncbi:MAG TPA: hypothetical protein VFN54_08895 [Acidimicrobiales bacterium]|nr:hypothetical protein [Acidimicrobiales bacterium]
MLDPRFVYLAVGLSALGATGYIRDTLRGLTAPNRVTWTLWGLEGLLAFGVESQQNVGLARWMTLALGVVPIVVVAASFRDRRAVWRLGVFDVVCGVISVAGIVFWAVVNEATVAIVAFIVADQVAALPTFRKSWLAPESETHWVFFLGCANCVITVLTLKVFTTAGVVYPGVIAVSDLVLALVIAMRLGPRWRASRALSMTP